MKKMIFALAGIAALAGCEKKESKEMQEAPVVQERTSNSYATDKQALEAEGQALMRYTAFTTRKCPSEIVYYDAPGCSSKLDVKNYVIANHDTDKTKLAGWLKTNGSKICFAATDAYIECIHRVDDPSACEILNQVEPIADITLATIIELARNEPTPIDYKQDFYQHYVRIFVNGQGKGDAQIVDNYDPFSGGCYSMPFLRILGEMYGEDLTIQIKEASIYSMSSANQPKKFMAIWFNNDWHYYDFSQIPTVTSGPIPIMHYLFSPL